MRRLFEVVMFLIEVTTSLESIFLPWSRLLLLLERLHHIMAGCLVTDYIATVVLEVGALVAY